MKSYLNSRLRLFLRQLPLGLALVTVLALPAPASELDHLLTATWGRDFTPNEQERVHQLIQEDYPEEMLELLEQPILNRAGKWWKIVRHPLKSFREASWFKRAVIFNEFFLEPGIGMAGLAIGGQALVLVPITQAHLWDLIYYSVVLGLPGLYAKARDWIRHGGVLEHYRVLESNPAELLKRVRGYGQFEGAEFVLLDRGRLHARLPRFIRVVSAPEDVAAERQFATLSIGEIEAAATHHGVLLELYESIREDAPRYARYLLEEIRRIPQARAEVTELLARRRDALPAVACKRALEGR